MAPWRERKCYTGRVAALSLIKLISIAANRSATCKESESQRTTTATSTWTWTDCRRPAIECSAGN